MVQTSREAPIEATVAQIIDDHELAFTAGAERGVHAGDQAEVYMMHQVTDPVSKDVLGDYRQRLVRLQVIVVQPKFSIGRVIDTVAKPPPLGAFGAIGAALASYDTTLVRLSAHRSDDASRVYIPTGANVTITPRLRTA